MQAILRRDTSYCFSVTLLGGLLRLFLHRGWEDISREHHKKREAGTWMFRTENSQGATLSVSQAFRDLETCLRQTEKWLLEQGLDIELVIPDGELEARPAQRHQEPLNEKGRAGDRAPSW